MKQTTLAINIIKEALKEANNPVVAFSGGKDSTTVLNLVRSVNPNIKAVFCNTRVEARETIQYCHSIDNLVELKPDKGITFWKICDTEGFPGIKSKGKRHGNKCCWLLKEKPALNYYKENNVDLVFTGLTMAESRNRMMMLKRMGHTYFHKSEKRWKCHPIFDWTEKNVWRYIRDNDIPYNTGYDSGWKRCGCVPCTAYISWKKRLANDNPKMLRIVLKKRYGQLQCGDFYGFGHDLKKVK